MLLAVVGVSRQQAGEVAPLAEAQEQHVFVEKVVCTLIKRGALAQAEDGTWEAPPLIETVSVPHTLKGLLMTRLDRLIRERARTANRTPPEALRAGCA